LSAPTSEQVADLLDAELREPAPARDVVDLRAVVDLVLVRLVHEAVELGADLAQLGDDDLLVAAPAVGGLVHEPALGVHVETPGAEERHGGVQHAADLDDLAGLDQPRGLEHRLRLLVVGRAPLVVRAPLRRVPLALGRRLPGLGVGCRDQAEREGRGDTERECAHGGLPGIKIRPDARMEEPR